MPLVTKATPQKATTDRPVPEKASPDPAKATSPSNIKAVFGTPLTPGKS